MLTPEQDLENVLAIADFGQIPEDRVYVIKDLVKHGEYGVAIELLCENLNDFEVVVSEGWALALEMTMGRFEIDDYYKEIVRKLRRRA
jgi:hypothetical protein